MINEIVRKAKKRKLNILCAPTHERTSVAFARTGHSFYLYQQKGIKGWNHTYAAVPDNHFLMPENWYPSDVVFDLVFSQEKSNQFPIMAGLAERLGAPLLSLEHTLPYNQQAKEVFRTYLGDRNVFISEYSRAAWDYDGDIIEHGIDTELFKPNGTEREPYLLSIVNDWKNRDWACGYKLWTQVANGLSVQVFGDNPGLSIGIKPDELVSEYSKAQVFLNTSLVSPVPTVLLEAAACECAIVTTANCAIPDIFINGYNCLSSNDPRKLRQYCEVLLNDPELARRLGRNARETVVERFGMDRFVRDWNKLFDEVSCD